jgi:hypothetical protein
MESITTLPYGCLHCSGANGTRSRRGPAGGPARRQKIAPPAARLQEADGIQARSEQPFSGPSARPWRGRFLHRNLGARYLVAAARFQRSNGTAPFGATPSIRAICRRMATGFPAGKRPGMRPGWGTSRVLWGSCNPAPRQEHSALTKWKHPPRAKARWV